MTEKLDEILREHAFLDGLDAAACSLVHGCARHVSFEGGSYLFHVEHCGTEASVVRVFSGGMTPKSKL